MYPSCNIVPLKSPYLLCFQFIYFHFSLNLIHLIFIPWYQNIFYQGFPVSLYCKNQSFLNFSASFETPEYSLSSWNTFLLWHPGCHSWKEVSWFLIVFPASKILSAPWLSPGNFVLFYIPMGMPSLMLFNTVCMLPIPKYISLVLISCFTLLISSCLFKCHHLDIQWDLNMFKTEFLIFIPTLRKKPVYSFWNSIFSQASWCCW